MSFNINLVAYVVVYLLSILFLFLIFLRFKNFLLKEIQNSMKIKNQELSKLINEFNNTFYKQLKVVKKEFEVTQNLQKEGITTLVKFNEFLIEIPQRIEKLNYAVAQRKELENEIIKLKKIIKRRKESV
jgi:predicted PurR-regulated permease PerM